MHIHIKSLRPGISWGMGQPQHWYVLLIQIVMNRAPRHRITKCTATFEGKKQKCSLTVYFQYICHLSQGHVTLWCTSLGEGRLRVYTLLHLWGAQENTVACEGPSHLWKQQRLGYSHVLADTQKQAKDESQAVQSPACTEGGGAISILPTAGMSSTEDKWGAKMESVRYSGDLTRGR